MGSFKGLALLIPGVMFFVGFTVLNSFTDGALRIALLMAPTIAILIGVTMLCQGSLNKGYIATATTTPAFLRKK